MIDTTPQQSLMRAIVCQAMRDALTTDDLTSSNECGQRPNVIDRDKAATWINRCGKHMQDICWQSGVDPDHVVAEYNRLLHVDGMPDLCDMHTTIYHEWPESRFFTQGKDVF